MEKRKGSRLITVGNREYSWFRGKTATEIRNLATKKKVIVNNDELSQTVTISACEWQPCSCSDYDAEQTTPRLVASYISRTAI